MGGSSAAACLDFICFQLGCAAAEIAQFDGIGGKRPSRDDNSSVLAGSVPIPAEQVGTGRMIKMISVEFPAGTQVVDHA